MFTPQQIDQIAFKNAPFNGYDKKSVDEILEPLTEDYITLYKENALLKSKMRVLVSKLEEYRKNETSMKDAIVNAQKTCDMMVKEAEAKCTQMLTDANAAAALNAKNADALIAAEEARVEEAKRAAAATITETQAQIRIKDANRPAKAAAPVAPAEHSEAKTSAMSDADTEAVANEISQNLEALVGTTDEPAPKAAPKHPVSETTSKFINLQFGRNYDPSNH